MKNISIVLLFLKTIMYTSAFAQPTLDIPTGTLLYVPTGADICAGTWGNISGNLIGEGTQCEGALPVELSLFTIEIEKGSIILNWVTETEVDNYGFDIERCIKRDVWEKIGFVEGNGNSNSPKSYSYRDSKPIGGCKFQYRLKQIDTDGQYEYSDIVEVKIVPTEFTLFQNYPNPFNSTTLIRYSLPHSSNVEIFVFNAIGEMIAKEFVESQEKGNYEWAFTANDLSSGAYFYRLQAGSFVETKKMVLMK